MTSMQKMSRVQFGEESVTSDDDWVAAEEPLEIRVQGYSVAVVMRTPGADLELALGFCLTEGIVDTLDDIQRIDHCDVVVHPDAEDNVVQVRLRDGLSLDIERFRRNLFASSSCGICGKATLEQVMRWAHPIHDEVVFDRATLSRVGAVVSRHQAIFAKTGGVHAAAIFDRAGDVLAAHEDVGRHNAVDKAIGAWLWPASWPAQASSPTSRRTASSARLAVSHAATRRCGLWVSGRISYEIIQKAAFAQIPVVVGVSAPTSLAVRAAERLGIALLGFARGSTFNVYCGQVAG